MKTRARSEPRPDGSGPHGTWSARLSSGRGSIPARSGVPAAQYARSFLTGLPSAAFLMALRRLASLRLRASHGFS